MRRKLVILLALTFLGTSGGFAEDSQSQALPTQDELFTLAFKPHVGIPLPYIAWWGPFPYSFFIAEGWTRSRIGVAWGFYNQAITKDIVLESTGFSFGVSLGGKRYANFIGTLNRPTDQTLYNSLYYVGSAGTRIGLGRLFGLELGWSGDFSTEEMERGQTLSATLLFRPTTNPNMGYDGFLAAGNWTMKTEGGTPYHRLDINAAAYLPLDERRTTLIFAAEADLALGTIPASGAVYADSGAYIAHYSPGFSWDLGYLITATDVWGVTVSLRQRLFRVQPIFDLIGGIFGEEPVVERGYENGAYVFGNVYLFANQMINRYSGRVYPLSYGIMVGGLLSWLTGPFSDQPIDAGIGLDISKLQYGGGLIFALFSKVGQGSALYL